MAKSKTPSYELASVLTGETRLIPMVGDPVAQAKSPEILSAIFAGMGVKVIVVPMQVPPDGLDRFFCGIAEAKNIPGMLITIPHKPAVPAFCSAISERADYAGAVNVLHRREAGWYGDNTDGIGHCNAVMDAGGVIDGKNILLIGAGGAGSAMAYRYLESGAKTLAVHDIDHGKRDQLINRLAEKFPGRIAAGTDDPAGFDIIANATPLGMKPDDPMPFKHRGLQAGQCVADVVTMPEKTALLEYAESAGCRIIGGVDMFRCQAELLAEILLGKRKQA